MSHHRRTPTLADPLEGRQQYAAKAIALAALCALLTSCTAPPSGPRHEPGEIRIALEAAPLSLDPRFTTDATGSQISDLLAEGLLRGDENGTPELQLAAGWTRPDPRTYEFELRPEARFSDGSVLQADDVKATFESVLDDASGSPKRSALGPLYRIESPDPRHVVFKLREPFGPFLDACRIGILPARLIAANPRDPVPPARVVGVGPFRITQFSPDDKVVLTRNPEYLSNPPRLENVSFQVIPDATTRLLALQSGSVDLVQNGIEPLSLPWLRNQPHLRVETSPGTTYQYLGMNLRRAPLADQRVRRALALAIDRDAIVRGILGGLATPATGMLPPTNWAYFGDVRSHAYDPKRAASLLDAAGYPDPDGSGPQVRFQLSYKTTTVDLRRRIAEAVQRQLAEIGIGLEIQSHEWATFYEDIRAGRFDLFSLAWVGIADPDLYYLAFNSHQQPPRGNNRGGFNDPVTDALTERARSTTDYATRRRLYRKVQERLSRLLPALPLWWAANVAVSNRRVQGYTVPPEGGYAGLRSARIEEH